MLVKELIELYEGKKAKKPVTDNKPTVSMEDQLAKFAKQGGEIIGDIKKGNEIGKVGAHNKGQWNQAIIVFYPDGSYQRFDYDSRVTYKDGWTGVEIDSEHLKGPKRELTDYERRVKEFEKNKKLYAKAKIKKSKKFGKDVEQASKWLAAADLDAPENKDIKRFLQKKDGVVDAMSKVYQVILADTPEFEQESLNMKLKTVLDLDYMEKFGGITKLEKREFMKLPGKFQRWAAASVLI
jgi:hypothetical protein